MDPSVDIRRRASKNQKKTSPDPYKLDNKTPVFQNKSVLRGPGEIAIPRRFWYFSRRKVHLKDLNIHEHIKRTKLFTE